MIFHPLLLSIITLNSFCPDKICPISWKIGIRNKRAVVRKSAFLIKLSLPNFQTYFSEIIFCSWWEFGVNVQRWTPLAPLPLQNPTVRPLWSNFFFKITFLASSTFFVVFWSIWGTCPIIYFLLIKLFWALLCFKIFSNETWGSKRPHNWWYITQMALRSPFFVSKVKRSHTSGFVMIYDGTGSV